MWPLLPPSVLPHLPLHPHAWWGHHGGELPAGLSVYRLHMPLGSLVLKSSDKVALLFPVARGQPEGDWQLCERLSARVAKYSSAAGKRFLTVVPQDCG